MTTDALLAAGTGLVRPPAGTPVTDWPSIRRYVLKRDGHLCQICRLREASDADHVWPRRLGGTDHVGNLRAACGPCNKTKGDRVQLSLASPVELMTGIRALSERVQALNDEVATMAAHILSRRDVDLDDLNWLTAELRLLSGTADWALRNARVRCDERRIIAAVPDADVIDLALASPPAVPA